MGFDVQLSLQWRLWRLWFTHPKPKVWFVKRSINTCEWPQDVKLSYKCDWWVSIASGVFNFRVGVFRRGMKSVVNVHHPGVQWVSRTGWTDVQPRRVLEGEFTLVNDIADCLESPCETNDNDQILFPMSTCRSTSPCVALQVFSGFVSSKTEVPQTYVVRGTCT